MLMGVNGLVKLVGGMGGWGDVGRQLTADVWAALNRLKALTVTQIVPKIHTTKEVRETGRKQVEVKVRNN